VNQELRDLLRQLRAIGVMVIGAGLLAASGSFAAAGGDLGPLVSFGVFGLAFCFGFAGAADLVLGVIDRSMRRK
jgi:amino acid permease